MDEQSPTAVEADGPGSVGQPARGPLGYAAAAVSIVRLDTEEIVRVSRDPMALLHGTLGFFALGGLLSQYVQP